MLPLVPTPRFFFICLATRPFPFMKIRNSSYVSSFVFPLCVCQNQFQFVDVGNFFSNSAIDGEPTWATNSLKDILRGNTTSSCPNTGVIVDHRPVFFRGSHSRCDIDALYGVQISFSVVASRDPCRRSSLQGHHQGTPRRPSRKPLFSDRREGRKEGHGEHCAQPTLPT